MTTIKDISKACGVSPATVSKALNGYPEISAETVELVRRTAREMRYMPDAAARSLKTKTNDQTEKHRSCRIRRGAALHELGNAATEPVHAMGVLVVCRTRIGKDNTAAGRTSEAGGHRVPGRTICLDRRHLLALMFLNILIPIKEM